MKKFNIRLNDSKLKTTIIGLFPLLLTSLFFQNCSQNTEVNEKTEMNSDLNPNSNMSTNSLGDLDSTKKGCDFGGVTINHGASVLAYENSKVEKGQSCNSEHRICSNGILSGTFTSSTCETEPVPEVPTCKISSLIELKNCFQKKDQFEIFELVSDLECSGVECCAADSSALINLDNVVNKVLKGNGHYVHRKGNQKVCPVLNVRRSSNVTIENINFDEDEKTLPCKPTDKCPDAIQTHFSTNLTFESIGLYNAKAYGINVWGNNQNGGTFKLNNSVISNTGLIGLIAGNAVYKAEAFSTSIIVTNSVFARTRTNALAFVGVTGQGTNIVKNNVFSSNHYEGQWIDPQGLPYNGGQVYFNYAQNIEFADNIIANSFCKTCDNTSVWGIEFAPDGQNKKISIHNNYFYNGLGSALFLNLNTPIDESVLVNNNRIYGYTVFLSNYGKPNLDKATIGINDFQKNYPYLDRSGQFDATIFSYIGNNEHLELPMETTATPYTLKTKFKLSLNPRAKGEKKPILRCIDKSNGSDFVTSDASCNGTGNVHSILGFSYEHFYQDSLPFYSCQQNGISKDHFLSWSSDCEGQKVIELVGYALK